MKQDRTLSRRQALQMGTVAGVAALGATAPEAEDAKPVRIGIVGMGRRGTHLLDLLLGFPEVQVPAVCDIVESRAARAQDKVEKARGVRPEAYTKGERDFENLVVRDDLDGVLCATNIRWHTPVMVAAMRAGKFGATEVPAAATLDECWDLVRTSEQTGMPCMMLENVCYFQNVLTLLRMVREDLFGELLHAEVGYQHDCRFLAFTEDGNLTWRGEMYANKNGNVYPTHPIGPVAQWFNINRGDRFTRLVSMSTKSRCLKEYARDKLGADHPLSNREYSLGDINTCLLETANGCTVTLYFDMSTPRPYDLILRLQGTKGLHFGSVDSIYLDGVSPGKDQYEPFAPYLERYAHPLWTELETKAKEAGGHGGADYITLYEFLKAVRSGSPPQDVYDAATWSAITPLSIQSVSNNGTTLDFPDFTGGQWKSRAPVPIYGA